MSRLFALAAFFTVANVAQAQTGTISGRVTVAGTSTGISGVNVQAVSGTTTAASVISGENGNYRIGGLNAGTYTIVATKIGFGAKRDEGVTVSAGGTATANFAMTELAAVLNPIVTTDSRGARASKILDAPASISVINSERIANTVTPTIAGVLKTTPGLSVSQGGLVQSNVVSRGFNNAFSGAMLMLQDYRFAGVPSLRVNVPFLFTGTSDDIDRIEVLNGPASALYGPNSANGVLHIITKSPFNSKGTTVTLDGGGQAVMRGALRHATTYGEHWGIKLSGEYMTGTDWKYNDPNEPATYPTTAPTGRAGKPIVRDFGLRRYSGEARFDYRGSADLENTFTAGYSKIGSAIELTTAFGAAQVKNWNYQNFQERFRYKKFFAQAFYNANNSGNKNPTDLGGTYYLRTGIPVVDKSNVAVFQVQQGFNIMDATMVAGVDYIKTQPRSEGSIFGRNEGNTDIMEYGAYLQTTLPLSPKVDLITALRGDRTDRLNGTQFSPRLAFMYKANANNNLRATFSRAFNSPASFSYFLDQVSNPNQAPGFALRAVGNPPKEGWSFNRSCDATVNAGLCMHSPWLPSATTNVSSSSANAFPGFIAALPTVINSLPTLSATQKAQLTGLLASLNPILAPLRPTPTNIGSVLRIGSAAVTVTDVKDLKPLGASFNNTWELGYKGIIGERLRLAVDLWYQVRGDVGAPIGQANPLVFYDPATLGAYLVTNITPAICVAPCTGTNLATAQATATAYANALVPVMAALPQGAVAFTNTKLAADQSIIATYTQGVGELDVHGVDVAVDFQADDRWLISGTVSHMGKIVFPEVGGAINPLMSNSPKWRATTSARFSDDAGGMWLDGTVRYSDAFPVNSGLLNSLGIPPNPAGTALYSPVPANTQVDVGASFRLGNLPGRAIWSLTVQNLLDNRTATFAGTPQLGRLFMTRLKFDF